MAYLTKVGYATVGNYETQPGMSTVGNYETQPGMATVGDFITAPGMDVVGEVAPRRQTFGQRVKRAFKWAVSPLTPANVPAVATPLVVTGKNGTEAATMLPGGNIVKGAMVPTVKAIEQAQAAQPQSVSTVPTTPTLPAKGIVGTKLPVAGGFVGHPIGGSTTTVTAASPVGARKGEEVLPQAQSTMYRTRTALAPAVKPRGWDPAYMVNSR